MTDENPCQTPQTLGDPADNRRLRGIAKVFLAIGAVCFVIGAGLTVISVFMMIASFGVIARSSGTQISSQEVAARLADASVYWSIGVPFTVVGAVVAVPSGILWFLTPKPRGHEEAARLKQ
jgi:hypothetical protein